MIATFRSAIPQEDYILDVVMTNGNRLSSDMKPYLDTVQFCPLKDRTVWKNIEVRETCLCWQGDSRVELSIDTLLGLFKAGKGSGSSSGIKEVLAEDNWLLRLKLDNGNTLFLDMGQLLEFSAFAPLLQKDLWRSIRINKSHLIWENKSIRLELPIDTVLDYFA